MLHKTLHQSQLFLPKNNKRNHPEIIFISHKYNIPVLGARTKFKIASI